MIGKDETNEEVVLKVNDRRKFNPDGSLREGVEIRREETNEETQTQSRTADESLLSATGGSGEPLELPDEAESDEEEIPGADDPASFVNFLSTLATNAAAALGAMPHPVTGQRTLDLDTGKYWLDVLGMLKEKTKGNLHPQESRLLEGLLGDLRMQYVQLVRMTEEKLKAQAAQKFSANDILGKK
jgi:hypothetical protein